MPDARKHHRLLSVPINGRLPRGTPFGSDYDAAVAQAHAAWADVRRQIETTRPDIVLMSREFLLMAAFVERITDFGHIPGARPGARIHCLSAPPSKFYVSAMQQWVKASANLLPPDPPPVLSQLDRFAALGKATARSLTGQRSGTVGDNGHLRSRRHRQRRAGQG